MITDCPNCSWVFESEESVGGLAHCPYCCATFMLLASPFEQLKAYVETVNANAEKSSFLAHEYVVPGAFKNYVGWVLRRIQANQPYEIFKLCCIFMSTAQAEMMLEVVWHFDVRQYINAPDEACVELLAIWIVTGFCLLDHPESLEERIAEHLWVWPIGVRPEYMDLAMQRVDEWRLNEPLDMRPDVVMYEDLEPSVPIGNPLFDWAEEVPPAVRQRLILALCYTDHSLLNGERCRWIQLDRCTYYDSRMHGVDYGYATNILMESNIFCDPLIEDFEHFFSKDQYSMFLSERGIATKKSYTRKKMLDNLLTLDDGEAWMRAKVAENGYVRIHPSLVKYAAELLTYYRQVSLLWKAILMLDVQNDCSIVSFLSKNKDILQVKKLTESKLNSLKKDMENEWCLFNAGAKS